MIKDDEIRIKMDGFITIREKDSGKIILDYHNAIHPENMSLALIQSLNANPDGYIDSLAFGNAGVRITSENKYLYSVPQTLGRTSSLYNETYRKRKGESGMSIKDDLHITGNQYSDLLVKCELDYNEPEDIENIINNDEVISEYTISEMGLLTKNNILLTHSCFAPITKTNSVAWDIEYLLRLKFV